MLGVMTPFLLGVSRSPEPALEHPAYFGCEENGHSWQFAGRAEDGTTFYRCRRCGATSEN
jgi:hypothetical protein